MGMTIDPQQEQRIRVIAETQGRPANELLSEIVEIGISHEVANSRPAAGDTDTKASRQRAALMACFDVVDKLDPDVEDDGKGSVRHDEIIYRRDW